MPSDPQRLKALEARAEELAEDEHPSFEEVRVTVNGLKKMRALQVARTLLEAVRKRDDSNPWLRQQHAYCTYRDAELPVAQRLDRAWEVLSEGEDDMERTNDSESLGLAGAIWKRKWQHDAQVQHLIRSLAYYERGHETRSPKDCGYTGINAAFILDVLADIEGMGTSASAQARRARADEIRKQIAAALERRIAANDEYCNAESYWVLATLGEACFGLCRYAEARRWLLEARDTHPPAVEFESTAQQLGALARLRPDPFAPADARFEDTTPGTVLAEFLGGWAEAAYTAYRGKVGLALSGGGFRASFFHIGVLARLAELDMLRHIDVLSCVSGGSIVGAHYYLLLRNLLNETQERDLTQRHYRELVEQLQRDFLSGVKQNIRMRVAANPIVNLKMIFWPGYTRTLRAGELYESELYSSVAHSDHPLKELLVNPAKDENQHDFNPREHNWRRSHKVPMLVINATALNTGHDWQFTTSWMGEAPAALDEHVDANYRLRRLYYAEAPNGHDAQRLGSAVAASAAVPGLFDPVLLTKLYQDIKVRLVDGGVHDNQGVASILEQECSVVLVSDASGQMDARDDPSGGTLGVLLRSNNILMSRVREAQFRDLEARRASGLVRGLMFLHLRKDLEAEPKTWIGGKPSADAWREALPDEQRGPKTTYGMRRDMQRAISAIRTDLDAFCEVEAYALMTSGYLMAKHEFDRCIRDFGKQPQNEGGWDFLAVQDAVCGNTRDSDRVLEILKVGKQRFFKIWLLKRWLTVLGAILLAALVAGIVILVVRAWDDSLLSVGTAVKVIGAFAAIAVLGKLGEWLMRALDVKLTIAKTLGAVAAAFGGWIIVRVAMLFDKVYLNAGKVPRES